MNPEAAALLAEFEAAAQSAQKAEEALRRKMAAEIAAVEKRRVVAFRRTRLIRALASAAAETEESAVAAQRGAVREELNWQGANAAHEEVLDRLQPVGRAVWRCVRDAPEGTAVNAELAAFETWFEAERGNSFYRLFDQLCARGSRCRLLSGRILTTGWRERVGGRHDRQTTAPEPIPKRFDYGCNNSLRA
jgi:hypothetical protein